MRLYRREDTKSNVSAMFIVTAHYQKPSGGHRRFASIVLPNLLPSVYVVEEKAERLQIANENRLKIAHFIFFPSFILHFVGH